MYEPFVHALSLRFLMPLPPVFTDDEPVDNWQTSAAACDGPGDSSPPSKCSMHDRRGLSGCMGLEKIHRPFSKPWR